MMAQGRFSTCHDSHDVALCYELYHRGDNNMDGLRRKDPNTTKSLSSTFTCAFIALIIIGYCFNTRPLLDHLGTLFEPWMMALDRL